MVMLTVSARAVRSVAIGSAPGASASVVAAVMVVPSPPSRMPSLAMLRGPEAFGPVWLAITSATTLAIATIPRPIPPRKRTRRRFARVSRWSRICRARSRACSRRSAAVRRGRPEVLLVMREFTLSSRVPFDSKECACVLGRRVLCARWEARGFEAGLEPGAETRGVRPVEGGVDPRRGIRCQLGQPAGPRQIHGVAGAQIERAEVGD